MKPTPRVTALAGLAGFVLTSLLAVAQQPAPKPSPLPEDEVRAGLTPGLKELLVLPLVVLPPATRVAQRARCRAAGSTNGARESTSC